VPSATSGACAARIFDCAPGLRFSGPGVIMLRSGIRW
jgi:hypothetical protein